jgi:hypothetical protein
MHSARRCNLLAVALVAASMMAVPAAAQFTSTTSTKSSAPRLTPVLDSARTTLARYQNVLTALGEGYLSTVACFEFPEAGHAGATAYPAGGMGVHLLNPALVGSPVLDPAKPQVLIYEPRGDTLKLVAAEWFVPVQSADQAAPQIFGRTLDGPMDGHPPIMPASLRHWDLHVWLWKENPAGVYAPTNPALRCPPRSPNTVLLKSEHGH